MKKLSIIMPVYNEEKTIREAINGIQNVKVGFNLKKEIIVVDDGSTDKTRKIIRELQKQRKNKNIIFIAHKKNKGKGAAVKTGFSKAVGDFIIIQDADLEYNPNDYPKLLAPLLKNKADVVYGSRFMKKHKAGYKLYYLGNLLINLVASTLFLKKITDVETCYKVIKKDIIKNMKLRADGFDIEPEITAKIIKKGYRIIELPIWYRGRTFKEGKKITWKDGVKAIYCLFKYRFVD